MSLISLITYEAPTLGIGNTAVTFDAVLTDTLESEVVYTEYPLESGANASDHGIIMPKKWSMVGAVSNNPLRPSVSDFAFGAISNLIESSLLSNALGIAAGIASAAGSGSTRASEALSKLLQLQRARVPFDVSCGDITLNNMVITKLSRTKDPDNETALIFEAELQELPLVALVLNGNEPADSDLQKTEISAQSIKKKVLGEVQGIASSFAGFA